MSRLDKEKQEILDSFDAGELQRSSDNEDRKARHQQYAEAMFKKDARINIRVFSKDLRGLQKKALAEGIPYQTRQKLSIEGHAPDAKTSASQRFCH